MEANTVSYLVTFVLNTAVIMMDVLIIYCAVKTKEVKRHYVLQMIFLAMAMDIAAYVTALVHDLPSIIMDMEVSLGTPVMSFMVIIIFNQWFTQLFVLLTLSVIHAFAVFFPTQFRTLSSTRVQIAIIMIVAINILLTAPLLTPCCGYYYFSEGHFWAWDLRKPYTYIYVDCNLVLQGLCAITVACVDVSIIWKIRELRVRSSTQTNVFTTTSLAQSGARVSREMHLAVNFVLMSACFLVMTTFFNVKMGSIVITAPLKVVSQRYSNEMAHRQASGVLFAAIAGLFHLCPLSKGGFFHRFLVNITYNLNLAKWSIYVLGNGTVRRKLLSLFRYQQVDVHSTIAVYCMRYASINFRSEIVVDGHRRAAGLLIVLIVPLIVNYSVFLTGRSASHERADLDLLNNKIK